MTQYPTDLTEKQWQVIKNILEPQARNRKHLLKEIMNAILYINKTGCQWYRREQENQGAERAHHSRYARPSVSRRNP